MPQQRIVASTLPTATPPVAVRSLLDWGDPMAGGVDYVAHVVVMPIILTIGMVNQCLNIFTLLHLPSTAFLYLKASAVADILSIISFIPFLIRQAELHDPYSHVAMLYHAHFELPIINALIAASALCIVAMTIDRYLSVCHPITFFNSSDSRKRTLAVISGLYLAAFIIFFPSIWQKNLKEDRDPQNQTFWELKRDEIDGTAVFLTYLFFRELITRWGPIVILVVLNVAMIRKLRKLDRKTLRRSIRQRSCNQGRSPREDRSRISVLLLVTATTFVGCNLPASFLSLLLDDKKIKLPTWQTFRAISNLLQTTSYLYNFYLYALCSSEYREAFRKLIGCQQDRLMKILAFLKSTSSCATQTSDDSPTKKSSASIPLVSSKKSPPALKIFNENEEMIAAVAM